MSPTASPTQTPAADDRRPLAGVRVLDFTMMMAGPYCTRFLADLGAEVIKVESSEGDYIRTRPPLRDGHSAYFGSLNCGKRSISLDLKNPQAVEAVKRLAAVCDVVVENFRPGVIKRLGLDYETLAASNPRLIYCSLSGFGQDGPRAQEPAYAQIVAALSGFDLTFAGYQDGPTRPANNGIFFADVLGGTYAFSAVLAALNHRHVTGRGQRIDATLMESMYLLMPYEVQEAQFPQKERRPVYPPFKTADGFLMISAVSPKNFEALLDAIGVAGWRDDALLATDKARQANWANAMQTVEAWTSTRNAEDCETLLNRAGVPAAAYKTVRQAIADPQAAHRTSLATVHDGGGEFKVPNLPYKMSYAHISAGATVPKLGEDTEQVLGQLAGLSAEEIAQARRRAT